jgi:hypothetical protein
MDADHLSDGSLRHVFYGAFSDSGASFEGAVKAGLRALRNHILRVLAEQAGDPEALGRDLWQSLQEADLLSTTARGWEIAPKHYQQHFVSFAKAVAARAVAPLVAEALALREAILKARWALINAVERKSINDADYAEKVLAEAYARPLPYAARRVEDDLAPREARVPFYCTACGENGEAELVDGQIFDDPDAPCLRCLSCGQEWRVELWPARPIRRGRDDV